MVDFLLKLFQLLFMFIEIFFLVYSKSLACSESTSEILSIVGNSSSSLDTNSLQVAFKEKNQIKINPCYKIIELLIRKKYEGYLLKHTKNLRKNKTSFSFSLSLFGPSLSISLNPYLDEKEKMEIKRNIYKDLEGYSKELEDYLVLLRSYLFYKNIRNWEEKRFKYGMDKIKENLQKIQKYEELYGKLRAKETRFLILGINQTLLHKCYFYTYPKKPFNPIKKINEYRGYKLKLKN